MGINPDEIKRAKELGFLRNRGTDRFSARILTGNGTLTGAQLKLLGEAAERFGNGTAALTTRLTVEFPGVALQDVDAFREFVAREGMTTGGTGSRVRPVAACKGTTCIFGQCDTQGIAAEIHRRFFVGYGDVALPHKFKIAVGGCPNNCLKPDLNDLGLMGQRDPQNRPGEQLLKIFLGGRWGREKHPGLPLSRLFTVEEALDIVEKALLLFKSRGQQRERFSVLVDRLGIEETERLQVSDELLRRKEEILAMN